MLRQGVDSGAFRIVDPRLQAHLLRGMVRSVLISGDRLTPEEMVDVIVDTFLNGVRHGAPHTLAESSL